jgi:hypothetical protein
VALVIAVAHSQHPVTLQRHEPFDSALKVGMNQNEDFNMTRHAMLLQQGRVYPWGRFSVCFYKCIFRIDSRDVTWWKTIKWSWLNIQQWIVDVKTWNSFKVLIYKPYTINYSYFHFKPKYIYIHIYVYVYIYGSIFCDSIRASPSPFQKSGESSQGTPAEIMMVSLWMMFFVPWWWVIYLMNIYIYYSTTMKLNINYT